jgi:hypothetical protein
VKIAGNNRDFTAKMCEAVMKNLFLEAKPDKKIYEILDMSKIIPHATPDFCHH